MCATWGDWSSWSDCSVAMEVIDCGNGVKYRNRDCELKLSDSATSKSVAWRLCGGGSPRHEMNCNAGPCEDDMLIFNNQISHGYYVEIDSSLLSGQGSAFQQCADYCYSLKGMGSTNLKFWAIAV